MGPDLKRVHVRYFAAFREAAGIGGELVETSASTLSDLYSELKGRHGFSLSSSQLKVSKGLEIVDLSGPVEDGDEIVFIPPVAGG